MTEERDGFGRVPLARPWCCPEPRCELQWQARNKSLVAPLDVAQPGESFHCFGRNIAEIGFVYDGIRHDNDLNVCIYSALKGIVRFQMNVDDLWLISRDFHEALVAVSPGTAQTWGPPVARGLSMT